MSLPYVNPSGEIIIPKLSGNECVIKRNLEEVDNLLKDARLLACEREQYALFGIIDMITERFKVIAKCVELPVCHKTEQGAI